MVHRVTEDEGTCPEAADIDLDDEQSIEATEYAGHFDAAKILAAISCYEYQACEHPEWLASEAKAFCDALRMHMIRMLPGYGGVWEVTDASEVTVGQAMRVATAAEMRRR